MKSIILQFTENSPFFNQTVMVRCSSFKEFEDKVQACFDQDTYLLQLDSLDRDNHDQDGWLYVGGCKYPCNIIRVWQEV